MKYADAEWRMPPRPRSRASFAQRIASIDTPDEFTAVVHLEEPYVSFVDIVLVDPLMPKHLLTSGIKLTNPILAAI